MTKTRADLEAEVAALQAELTANRAASENAADSAPGAGDPPTEENPATEEPPTGVEHRCSNGHVCTCEYENGHGHRDWEQSDEARAEAEPAAESTE